MASKSRSLLAREPVSSPEVYLDFRVFSSKYGAVTEICLEMI